MKELQVYELVLKFEEAVVSEITWGQRRIKDGMDAKEIAKNFMKNMENARQKTVPHIPDTWNGR